MGTLVLVVAVALAISTLCSILEAVLLSTSHSHIALLEEQGDRAGKLLAGLRQNIDEPIAAILTLNTIAHTTGASMGGAIALQVFGNEWMAVFSAVLTLLILIVSEILPKTIGARYWKRLSRPAAYVLRGMVFLMKPVLIPLSWIQRLLAPTNEDAKTVSRSELEVLAEIGRREGAIDEEEWQVVSAVINLDQISVGEVMTPRTQIAALPRGATVQEAKELMIEEGHLRVPVYEDSIDNIVGILLARDLWKADNEGMTDYSSILRNPYFVPESKPVEDLIREMRTARIKLAIVLDEFGGTAGLVTLEDLIEEIVGEIQDEHEAEPEDFEVISSSEVLVHGGAPLWAFNERFEMDLPDEDYDTVGGYVFGVLGRIPEPGDEVPLEGGFLRVVSMDGRRIETLMYDRLQGLDAAVDETPTP